MKDSQAKVLVTNAANVHRVDPSLVDEVLVLDDELLHEIAGILDEAAQKIERTK